MENFGRQLVAELAPYFITFIVTVVSLFLTLAVTWLKNRIQSEKAEKAIDIAESAVYDVVQHMEQTVRPMLSDGKLDDQERQLIKARALSRVKETLGPQIIKALTLVTNDVEKYLETKLEAAVHNTKNSK